MRLFFTRKVDLNLKRNVVKYYIWGTALYGAKTWTLRIFLFYPMPSHVLVDFVVLPPGHGRRVTDFWGWDAHEAQLRCPDNVRPWSGNRTWDLMISSQRLWPLDHEAGHFGMYIRNTLWWWTRKEKIIWMYRVQTAVLLTVKEEKNILFAIQRSIGHILSSNCCIKHVIERKVG